LATSSSHPPEGYADWDTWAAQNGMDTLIGVRSAIIDPDGVGPRIFIQKVPEPKAAKNRLHLDLLVSDARRVGVEEGRRRVDAEVRRLEGLGATAGRAYDENGGYWVTMVDPEGNEFCVQ